MVVGTVPASGVTANGSNAIVGSSSTREKAASNFCAPTNSVAPTMMMDPNVGTSNWDSTPASAVEDGSLCLALYFPPESELGGRNNGVSSPVWWPAVQHSSIETFVRAKEQEMNVQFEKQLRDGVLTNQRIRDIKKLLLRRRFNEERYQTRFHTLYYLARPLWEYRTSNPYGSTNQRQKVFVQDFGAGLVSDMFVLQEQPDKFPSKQIYLDFHRAVKEAGNIVLGETDDDSKQSNIVENALRVWEEWERQAPLALPAGPEDGAEQGRQVQNEQLQEDVRGGREDQLDDFHQFHNPHGSPMSVSQSVAAVSYTDASLESSRTNHTPANHERGRKSHDTADSDNTPLSSRHAVERPPKISPFPERSSFESIWHKIQLDGWDSYQDQETQEMVYTAPNGYTFPSYADFSRHLQHEYGWEPPVPPGQTRKTRRLQALEETASGDSSAITPAAMWAYVKKGLGWTHSKKPRDMPGHETWVYYRPGFSNKNRGVMGQDHFLTEDDLLKYCLENDIRPPPSPGNTTSDRDCYYGTKSRQSATDQGEDVGSMEVDEEEEDCSADADGDDDSGYETPTDQAPTAQDPGKPLDRDLSDGTNSECEEDRYEWNNLWPSLQRSGWEIKRARNDLDDWWYYKPVRTMGNIEDENPRQGPRRLQRGIDYFPSKEDVIAFCKERDDIRKQKHARGKHESRNRPRKKNKLDAPSLSRDTSERKNSASHSTVVKGTKKRGRLMKEAADDSTTKKKRKVTKPIQECCMDENLTIESTKNTAPWAQKAPLFEHKVAVGASAGITYHHPFYYLRGENTRCFTTRFESVTDIIRYIVSNEKVPIEFKVEKDVDVEFVRYLQYAFVPGKPSDWSLIRMITKAEASFLLREAGYECSASNDIDGVWRPPEKFVMSKLLKECYESFESLCIALRGLPDIESTAGTSRRRKPGRLSNCQTMALKLAMSEGFASVEYTDVEKPTKENDEVTNFQKNKKLADIIACNDTSDVATRSKGEKRGREKNNESDYKNVNPLDIKVKFCGEENPAPWVAESFLVPPGGWHKCYERMGFTFLNGSYRLPSGVHNPEGTTFSKTSDLQVFICQEGDYDKYLDKLAAQERSIVRRHLNYGHVPGTMPTWEKIRFLELWEVVSFLTLLGFEKEKDGWWKTPMGLPIIGDGQRYPSLSALGRALIRIPDLEDRTRGQANRRRARKGDQVLNNHQMMALRLRLAEGLEDDKAIEAKPTHSRSVARRKNSVAEASDNRRNEQTEGKICIHKASDEKISRAMYEVCHHAQVWKYLQNLGCTYRSSGKYRLPGDDSFSVQTQNELVEHILENTVAVLDWKACTLNDEQLSDLEFYFRCFNAKLKDNSLTGEATALVNKGNIPTYLSKLGISKRNDSTYEIAGERKTYNMADLVNKIRSTNDLYTLAAGARETPRRRRSKDDSMLSDVQILAIRLWSISVDIPLPNFPSKSATQYSSGENDEFMKHLEREMSQVVVKPMPRAASKSKVSDVEQIVFGNVPGDDTSLHETGSSNPLGGGKAVDETEYVADQKNLDEHLTIQSVESDGKRCGVAAAGNDNGSIQRYTPPSDTHMQLEVADPSDDTETAELPDEDPDSGVPIQFSNASIDGYDTATEDEANFENLYPPEQGGSDAFPEVSDEVEMTRTGDKTTDPVAFNSSSKNIFSTASVHRSDSPSCGSSLLSQRFQNEEAPELGFAAGVGVGDMVRDFGDTLYGTALLTQPEEESRHDDFAESTSSFSFLEAYLPSSIRQPKKSFGSVREPSLSPRSQSSSPASSYYSQPNNASAANSLGRFRTLDL